MMGSKKCLVLILSASCLFLTSLSAKAQSTPQTARQALIEMLFSKTPGTFEKHLPQAMKAALRKARADSGTTMLDNFSLLSGQWTAHGQEIQAFESGPTLVVIEDPQLHNKFEVTVEQDDLRGDEDTIDLGFRCFKDGQNQVAGTKFGLTFTMKQESGTWKLSQIGFQVGVSLTDPAFLKAISTGLKPGASSLGTTEISTSSTPSVTPNLRAINAANEASAVSALRTLNIAEVTYMTAYPAHGFTCALSDLGGMGGGGTADEHHALLVEPRLAMGKKNGYIFQLSGCDGSPASRYHVTAVPADPASGTRIFCSDESAVIRFSGDGKAESCLSTGQTLQ
jgi:type IV pilus assembly protein PilA